MGKLTPKPTDKKPLLTWEDLDSLLQANFIKQEKGKEPEATVNLNEYEITFDGLIAEAELANYKIEQLDNNYVKFT